MINTAKETMNSYLSFQLHMVKLKFNFYFRVKYVLDGLDLGQN